MPSLPGPHGPIAYERDALGYPSIRARDVAEGTYALGYLHAQDRLVQVTLSGLAARGELMRAIGDVPLARLLTRSVHAFGLAQGLEQQTERIDERGRALLLAYQAGFRRGALDRGTPIVLKLLRVAPFECTLGDLVALFRLIGYFGLTSMQLSAELALTDLAARGAPERVFRRALGDRARGLDLGALRGVELPPELSVFSKEYSGASLGGAGLAGSNAFAVSAARSSTGGALLLGEFHMEVGRFPPLLYAAHLELEGGAYLTGITIPGLPWFAAGRTEHVGWSYTFAHADNVDVVIERVKAGQYLEGGEYRPLKRREARVAIKGKPAETWVFHDNDYGAVLGDVEGEGERACVRLSGLEETYRAFSAAARVHDCRSVDELAEVQRGIVNLSLEAILVDRAGDIASIVTGRVDQRPADWTGAYPVPRARLRPGVPEPLSEELRPLELRPESGVLVSANQGGQGPLRELWCSLPEPLYRFERITELLAERAQHDLCSLISISYDTYDPSARRLLEVWARALPDHPLARRLLEWRHEQGDRELLGLFHALHEEALIELFAEDIGRPMGERLRDESMLVLYQVHLDAVLALEHPERLDEAGLRALLARAFERATAPGRAASVPVRLRFKHLVTRGRSPAFLGFDSPLVELPGSPVSVFQCRSCQIAGERLVYAPAFHLAFDMRQRGVWYNVPGGASESRRGVGYGRGVREWLTGELLPLGVPPGAATSMRANPARPRAAV